MGVYKSVDCCWFLGGVRYPRYSNSFQIFSPLSLLSFNYDHFEFHHHSSSSLNVLSEVAKMPENLWTRTPLVESPSLSSAAGWFVIFPNPKSKISILISLQ